MSTEAATPPEIPPGVRKILAVIRSYIARCPAGFVTVWDTEHNNVVYLPKSYTPLRADGLVFLTASDLPNLDAILDAGCFAAEGAGR